MRRRFCPNERIERLEDRICPSSLVPGDSTFEPGTGTESDSAVIESEMNPYSWIMMAMIPGDMMKIANEVDQSARAPGQAMAEPETSTMSKGMSNRIDSVSNGESAMSASSAMPPAQMIMAPEPLVRPGSSFSRRDQAPISEMSESDANEEKPNSDKTQQGAMSAGESDMERGYEPPRLAPGNLDPKLSPDLDPGPIAPVLERSTPSVSAP